MASMDFFDHYYLWPDEDQGFYPMFYPTTPRELAEGHGLLHRGWATHKYSVGSCPRGYAKSSRNYADMLMRMASIPQYSFIYATSSLKNVQKCSSTLRVQFTDNSRLIDDFGPEYGGALKPSRSSGRQFGSEFFELDNAASCALYSAKSKMRGGRPMCFTLDDPEYDPDNDTSMAVIRHYMQRLIFKVIMPMVTQPGMQVRWIGTFISKQHYLWHAMSNEAVEDPFGNHDMRFDSWYRIFVPAEYEDSGGKVVSAWPQVWPLTVEDKEEAAKEDNYFEDAVSLEEMRKNMGAGVYAAEMLGRPGDSEERYFAPLTKEGHGYWFENADEYLTTNPLKSEAIINFHVHTKDGDPELHRMPFKQFLAKCRRFITVDTSYTAESHSDYKVATLMGYYPGNVLFVLDMWAAQTKPQNLIEAAFDMAQKWKVPSIHVEYIKDGILVFNSLQSKARTHAKESMGYVHVPKVFKIRPGMHSKEGKIDAAMTMRMELGAIKFPLFHRQRRPWRDLFTQIDEFNPEAEDCGLQHDDHLDTVAMHMFVLKASLARFTPEEEHSQAPVERLKRGDYYMENGTPIAHGVDWSKVSMQDVMSIIANKQKKYESEESFA